MTPPAGPCSSNSSTTVRRRPPSWPAHFPSTRQAVVKHLRVLADAGLVAPERSGREVHYRATTARLADAVTWLIGASDGWDRRIDRLRARR